VDLSDTEQAGITVVEVAAVDVKRVPQIYQHHSKEASAALLLPSACYILSDESSIPFYSTSNGYENTIGMDEKERTRGKSLENGTCSIFKYIQKATT